MPKKKLQLGSGKDNTEISNIKFGFVISSLVISLFFSGISAISIYEYGNALGIIKENSQKLKDAGNLKLVSVTANPQTINVGQPKTPNEIKTFLINLNYTEGEDESASFKETENSIIVKPRFVEFHDLLINFQKNRISQIEDLRTGQKLSTAQLEPEILNQYLPLGKNEIGSVVNEEVKFERDVANTIFLDALLTVENRNFFAEPHGISWKSLARAISELAICKSGRLVGYNCKTQQSGASTITAQLVKNLLLSNEQTYNRKFKEFWLTIALEKYLDSKERILELYLNNVVIGEALIKDSPKRQIVGLAAAAKYLYKKELKELNLNESVTLACLLKMPNKLLKRDETGKLVNYDRLEKRRNKFLLDLHTIHPEKYSLEEINQALNEKIDFKFDWEQEGIDKASATFTAFTEKATEIYFRGANLSFEDEIVRVQTPGDPELLKAMHQILRSQLPDLANQIEKDSPDLRMQGSIVIYRSDSADYLSINSLEFQNREFHLSRHAFDSTGPILSLIKPFIYGFGLERNKIRLHDKIDPKFCSTPDWTPMEDNLTPLTYGQHLVSSNNLVPVCVLQKTGLKEFGQWWKSLTNKEFTNNMRVANGLTDEANLSAVDVAELFGLIGNKGRLFKGSSISRIIIGNQIVAPIKNEIQALHVETVDALKKQLQGVVDDKAVDGNFGTAKNLLKEANLKGKGYQFYAKTGSGKNDFWIAIGNGKIVIVIRLTANKEGNQDISTRNIFAAQTAGKIAKTVLKKIEDIKPELMKE